MSQSSPIIDTGFASHLAQGMGMGLHARQLQQSMLYREAELANREHNLKIAEDRLYQQGQIGNRRLDVAENWHDQMGQHHDRQDAMQQQRVDDTGSYHSGILDIRSGDLARKQEADNQKQMRFHDAGDFLYGTMHPSQDELGQQGPDILPDLDAERQRFMAADPASQRMAFHHWQRDQDKQALLDAEHARADKVRAAVLADPHMPVDHKQSVLDYLTDKQLRNGLPASMMGKIAARMFPQAPKPMVPNSAERSLQGLSEEQFGSELKSAQDPEQAWRYTPQYQTMIQAEANRRRQAPAGMPAAAPGASQTQPPAQAQPQPPIQVNPAALPAAPAQAPAAPAAPRPMVQPASPAAAASPPPLDSGLIQKLHQQYPGASDEQILQLHDQILGSQPAGGR